MPRDEDVDIPSLTLDHDEVNERRPNRPTGDRVKPKRRLNPPPAQPASAVTSPKIVYKKPSLLGVYFLLLLILAASGGAVFWLWQQNMQLRNELSGAKNEIENLDHQLLAADVSANKQGQTVEETLKTHDSEIRKLWGVSYDRNRKAIADNSGAIEELEKKMSVVRETSSTQGKRIAIQSDAFNELEDSYHKLVTSTASLDENIKTLSAQIAALTEFQKTGENQLQALKTQLDSQSGKLAALSGKDEAQALSLEQLSQDLAALQQSVVTLEKQPTGASSAELTNIKQTLSKHQEAIESSDAFRSQINSEIIRLRSQINQVMLQQQLNSEN